MDFLLIVVLIAAGVFAWRVYTVGFDGAKVEVAGFVAMVAAVIGKFMGLFQ